MKQGVHYHPFCGFVYVEPPGPPPYPETKKTRNALLSTPPPHLLSFLIVFLGLNCWVPCLFGDSSKLPPTLHRGLFIVLLMFTDTLGSLFGYR